ncbi:MAG: hypothetical protein LBJ70_04710, partial [Holosporales bacterium]|nr:hypothetical protein [Holosporales bacterium]
FARGFESGVMTVCRVFGGGAPMRKGRLLLVGAELDKAHLQSPCRPSLLGRSAPDLPRSTSGTTAICHHTGGRQELPE